MLVLARRLGEALLIGDDITITILGTGNQVRLGIEAPGDVRVNREEIYHRILTENNKQSIYDCPQLEKNHGNSSTESI